MKPSVKLNLKYNCRVCLEQAENMISIFLCEDNKSIASKISDCGGIEIETSTKDYPDKICPKCVAYLNIAYKFRLTCKNTDNLLRSLITNIDDNSVILSDPSTSVVIKQNLKISKNDAKNEFKATQHLDECTFEEIEEVNNEQHEYLDDNVKIEQQVIENVDEGDDDNDDDDVYQMYKNNIDYFENTEIIQPQQDEKLNVITIERNIKKEKSVVKRKSQKQISNEEQQAQKSIDVNEDDDLKYNSQNYTIVEIDKSDSSESKGYICEMCGNRYKKKVLLDSHMLWHTDEKPYKCEVCGRGFKVNFQLTRHMRVHTGDRPYSCNICGRKFGDYSTCKKHRRTHTGERPFKCDICNKAFTYSNVLKVHMTVHTGEKPFECHLCDKKFSQRHHLKAHLATLQHQGSGGNLKG